VNDLPPGLLVMLEASGGLLGLQIKGPIARAIKKQQADAVDAVITRFNSVSAVWPEFVDKVNVDRVGKIWVDAENAPIEMLNTEDEEQEIRDQRAQAQQQAQEDQDILNASQVAKDTGGIPQEA
jgi:Na+-transporting NADH:ubiquinone oxidoreductase subunit NqrC